MQLTIEVTESDLLEIARAGYADAASTNRKAREEALMVFVSHQCFKLATDKQAVAAQRPR